jgi:N-methylhydantoinase A/acetophenone carboxylase
MFTVDIDTGGTFTDGFITRDGELKTVKVLSTPHDLTVCFADCIREASKQLGLPVTELLSNTAVVRYSSTIGVNTLITRTGAKIGLIVSKGFKDTIYAKDQKEAEPLFDLVSRDMVVEVQEGVNDRGDITGSLHKDKVIESMQYLIDMGARAIAVSLKNSHLNPAHEKQIKKIIKEQYPNFYLGSVRVFLASEVSDQPGDFYRTNAVVINGYIHDSLVRYLYKAEDELKANLYKHSLMIAHSHGGIARVAKTRAIDTFSSGPALGLLGAAKIGKLYHLESVMTVDNGGTSLDLGVIKNGALPYSYNPHISGLPVSVPMIYTVSKPQASGSIAHLDGSKNLQIGPQSAGARPGPACFNLGGLEPTVTDADVALGLLDPDYFLGGRVKLNKDRSLSAIRTKIADPLHISVEEAAHLIRITAEKSIENEIREFLKEQGVQEFDRSHMALIVFGGAGPTHCCGFPDDLGFSQILISPYSSVFSAFGSSTTDLLHMYPKHVQITLCDGADYLTDYGGFNQVVKENMEFARRDIQGEGFSVDDAFFTLDLLGDEELSGARISMENLFLQSSSDVQRICKEFRKAIGSQAKKVAISTIILNAVVPMPHFELKKKPLASPDPTRALKTKRSVFWSPEVGPIATPIYERDRLSPGNLVVGPAIVEARDTTYVIPADRSLYIDELSHGIIKEA